MKFRKGGGATQWPWRQLEFRVLGRCIVINVSRVHPLPVTKIEDAR